MSNICFDYIIQEKKKENVPRLRLRHLRIALALLSGGIVFCTLLQLLGLQHLQVFFIHEEQLPPLKNKINEYDVITIRKMEEFLNQKLSTELREQLHKKNVTTTPIETMTLSPKLEIRSCRWDEGTGEYSLDSMLACHMQKGINFTIILYNPFHQSRILCGETVEPKGTIIVGSNNPCVEDPSRLFSRVPSSSNKTGMQPVKIRYGSSDNPKYKPFPLECDIPCMEDREHGKRGGNMQNLRIDGTDWSFVRSMEGPQHYKKLAIDPQAHLRNQFYMTTSFKSEVPVQYFSWDEYKIQRQPAVNYTHAIRGASFLAKNCNSKNKRESVVQALQKSTFRVDSLSKCLHNANPPPGAVLKDKVDVMRRYLFHLAFENQSTEDHMTEKLWGALESGTLPIYLGAPNVKEHAPPHSIIHVDDFNTTAELVEYLNEVASNQTLYESYHEWRTKDLPDSFLRKYNHTHTHSTCRLCRWAYSKLHGLGWNHEAQTVEEPKVPRHVCIDGNGLLSHPVQEHWYELSSNSKIHSPIQPLVAGRKSTCNLNDEVRTKQLIDGRLYRTVWGYDGVTDVMVMAMFSVQTVVLELKAPVRTKDSYISAIGNGQIVVQDEKVRTTILTYPKINDIRMPAHRYGIVELSIPNTTLPLNIRIIIEDVNDFYEQGKNVTSYFSNLMREDFYSPVEKFYAKEVKPNDSTDDRKR